MCPTDGSQTPASESLPAWLRPSIASMVVGTIFALGIPMAIGIVAFCVCQQSEAEYNRKTEMIARGEVKPEMLRVLEVIKGDGNWYVSLGKNEKAVAWRWDKNVDDLPVGAETAAYRFGYAYRIPRFDRGNVGPKWYWLAFRLVCAFLAGGVALLKALRWRARYSSQGNRGSSSSASGTPSHPPKAFSCTSMTFDHNPADAELTCLLGDRSAGPIRAVEEAGVLTASPWLFPMKYIVPWMLFVAIVITCVLCFVSISQYKKADHLSAGFLCFMLLLLWFAALPSFLGILAAMNRSFAKKGDYFKIDMARRTLELCRLDRTLKAGEIVALVVLTRWYRGHGEWQKTHQTGVLARGHGSCVDFFPLVRELGENIRSSRKTKWANRIAEIFQVPVRQIELNRSESKALNDC
jgi:hypothetical protein